MRPYVEWVVRHRLVVITLALLVTVVLAVQVKNLKVVIDPDTVLPQQHPYVLATNLVEKVFGSRYVVAIGITAKEGDAFQPHVLAKVQRVTAALVGTPGVVKGNVLSLSARKAKNIAGTADGMEVRPLMETVPQTPQAIDALRRAVRANPAYLNAIVSKDERTVAVIAEFKRPQGQGGFRAIMEKVRPIVDRERDDSVQVAVSGLPVFLDQLEKYSQRMGILFPLAVLITGLIHYEAFRTIQGLVLPLVTALLAVIWGLGVMGLGGVPMDVFNSTTPILILAVAAGHAVQILKRYYEEYGRLRQSTTLAPSEANRAAVVEAVTRIGPAMLTAGIVAALGFFSLLVFQITTIRTFGVFTGIGIVSALILEMTFIPALRSLLPAPKERESRRERERRVWDRITETFAAWVSGPGRRRIYMGVGLLLVLWVAGATQVVVDNTQKSYFFSGLSFRREDDALNERLGGTNTLYLLIEGKEDDAIKDPRVLGAMEAAQRFLESQPHVGKTLSIVDFIKRMNRAMHGDDPAYDRIPDNRDLISQYLLLYSMSGEPGDFDSYVDYGYRYANVLIFLKTNSSSYVQGLVDKLQAFLPDRLGDRVTFRIGGGASQGTAINEVMVHGKILNIIQIGAVILVITSLVFRSLLAGILVLVPLILAVLANFGLMGLTGMRLNIATAVISAMAVGIGADYAIYFIYRLREELARGGDEVTAVRTAYTTAGKAILFVASAISGGYAVLLLSYGFYLHMWYAIQIATAMLVSALGALTLLPSLILTFRPRFVFGEVRQRGTPAVEIATLLAVTLGLGLTFGHTWAADLAAREVMEKNFVVSKFIDSTSEATFTLINKTGQERVRKTFGTSKLQPNGIDNRRMVRFLSPPDVKGTVTLLVEHSDKDDDIWIYLPALKKVRRLVASNKKDSFVGTDFSYGDVIGHKVEEWDHRLVREEPVDGQPCYVIESIPKNDTVKSNSGLSKRVSWIRKDNLVTVKGEFWDPAGEPLKTARFTDVRLLDPARGRWQAMQLEAANLQTGHRTIIRFENYKVNQQVKDEFFTTRYMEREP
jgi:predicted RND superfamily exporter protein/outer membrane lipoprotein-sorting protein